MRRNFFNLFIFSFGLTCLSPTLVQAASKTPSVTEAPVTTSPTVQVNEGMADRIYRQSKIETAASSTNSWTVEPSFKMFFLSQFKLTNKYFTVPYDQNTSNITGLMVEPKTVIADWNNADMHLFFSSGYAYSQGIYQVESESGLSVKDAVELQWIPLQSGIEIMTKPFSSQMMTLGFRAGAGVDWYTQSGQLNGMNQTFWVPRAEVGPSLGLFSPPRSQTSGFKGVKISAVSYRSISRDQINRGWAANVGAQYGF